MSELEKAKGILKQLQGKGYANDRSQESYKKRAKRIEKELNDLEKSSNKKEIQNNESFAKLPRGLTFMIGNFKITT
ncbi:hypothetical protein EZY14_018755 [Kordia sp. TARA_039_SRF]|nr:hypothetical protein EZY14_018755 [Kordia sp. TARA_039_SRF]